MRKVPIRFEDYLRRENAEPFADGSTCPGCREYPTAYKVYGPNDTFACVPCLRHFHGDDIAEERMVHALLGGAVRAALEANADVELIRAAVNDAIDESVRQEERDHTRAGLRAA